MEIITLFNIALWFGLIVAWLNSDWPWARGPNYLTASVKKFYIPNPYGLDSLLFTPIHSDLARAADLFNCPLVKFLQVPIFQFVQVNHIPICSLSISTEVQLSLFA